MSHRRTRWSFARGRSDRLAGNVHVPGGPGGERRPNRSIARNPRPRGHRDRARRHCLITRSQSRVDMNGTGAGSGVVATLADRRHGSPDDGPRASAFAAPTSRSRFLCVAPSLVAHEVILALVVLLPARVPSSPDTRPRHVEVALHTGFPAVAHRPGPRPARPSNEGPGRTARAVRGGTAATSNRSARPPVSKRAPADDLDDESKSFRSRGRITPIRPAVSGSRARSPARCGSEVPERYAVRASSVDPGTDRTPPRWTRSAGSNSNQHVAADVRSTTG